MKNQTNLPTARAHGQPAAKLQNRLVRRSPSPLALEQRFMFDGAAVADAVDTTHQTTDSSTGDQGAHLLKVAATDSQSVSSALVAAQAEAERLVSQFLNSSDAQAQLFTLFHGQQGSAPSASWQAAFDQVMNSFRNGETPVRVELRSTSELQNAKGAFAISGTTGEATIYLNADWLAGNGGEIAGADSASITTVLVEELGHYLDAKLNDGGDTAGDEGEVFSRFVIDGTNPLSIAYLATQDDHGTLTLDGQSVAAEFASYTFSNAYEMVYDLDNDTFGKATNAITTDDIDVSERWADKEQNLHYFNSSVSLGQVKVLDGTGNQNFSGNDVSATSIVIGGTTYNGWISRPIKSNGVVRGFYFWTDKDFVDSTVGGITHTGLEWAQLDGNTDGDRNVLDNRGFLLVVDQTWFNSQISSTGIRYDGITKPLINNAKDGDLGAITVANIGSSSDRVDSALNSLLVPNSAPSAANDTLTLLEDSGTTTVSAANGLLSNDTDVNNDTLTITAYTCSGISGTPVIGSESTISGVGKITINANGSYSFTPDPDYNGTVPAITYTVSDGKGGTTTAVLSISVTPLDDAPVSTDDTITTSENTPKVLTLNDFGTYSDPENEPLAKIQITQLATHGSLQYWNGSSWAAVTLNQQITVAQILQGQLRFTPTANESGPSYATVGFKVSDGQAYSVNAYTLTVEVTAGNQAPVAVADTNTVTEAGCGVAAAPATGNVLTDGTPDSDRENQTLTVSAIAYAGGSKTVSGSGATTINGQYGTLTIYANGTYSYALDNSLAAIDAMNSGNTKTDTFSYTVTDGTNTSSTTLTLTINGTNDDPVAVDDFSTFIEETDASAGNHGTVTGNALTNDTDVDNTNSQLTVKLTDGSTPPSGTPTDIATFNASTPITSVTVTATTISGYDSPPSVLPGTAGTATSFQVSLDNGTSWITAKQLNGSDLTVYYVSSGGGAYHFSDNVALYGYQSAIFRYVQVSPAKEARWTVTLTSPVNSGGDKIYTASTGINDIQVGDIVSWSGSTGTIKVTAIDTTKGEITIDNDNNSATAYSVTLQNASLTFKRSTGGISISATQEYFQGTYGYLILNENGSYTYTLTTDLTASQVVTEAFTYTTKDPANCTDTAVITIRVTGVDAPKLANDTLVVSEDSGAHVTFNGSASAVNDSLKTNDINGTTITLGDVASFKVAGDSTTYTAGTTATISGVGTLAIAADGTVAFDPVDGYLGPVPTVTYTRTGSDSQPYTANLTITIQAVDHASVLAADTNTVSEDTTATGNVLANDTDVDNILSVASYSWNNGSSTSSGTVGSQTPIVLNGVTIGSLTLGSNGSYSFVPAANWNGRVPTITYTTNTGSTSTLDITVDPVNDAPALDLDGDDSSTAAGNDFKRTYTNGATDVAIADTDSIITDVDNTNIARALVVLINPQTGDTLNFNAPALLSTYGITAASTTTDGVITVTLTGSATLANYQAAIEAITFGSTGHSTADRVVSVKVNDGDLDSNTAYTTITISPDNRPVTVLGTVVNEASPYVMFEVSGAENQWVSLALSETSNADGNATLGEDFLPNLQYFDGATWKDYAGGLIQIPDTTANNGKLLVRTAVLQDSIWETTNASYETLKLTAYNAAGTANLTTDSGNPQADGTAQIRDDGQGSIFLGNNNGSNNALAPNTTGDTDLDGPDYPAMLDDDRPITVNNIAVNEGSPYAVLTISGYAGQKVSLAWVEGSAKKENSSAPVATDGTEDFGPALQYWDSSANGGTGDWLPYNGTSVTLSGSTLLVRTQINQDNVFEQQEAFNLAVTKLSSGTTIYGRVDIYDDGTNGVKFPGTVTGGTPDSNTTSLDDDRPTLNIADVNVEEGSQAVFNVTLTKPTSADVVVKFTLTSGTANSDDYDTDLTHLIVAYSGGPLTPDAFGRYTIPAGVLNLTVKVATKTDALQEAPETFYLAADVVDEAIDDSDTGTATITEKDAPPMLSINDVTVNEAAGTMTFTVTRSGATGTAATVDFATSDGTATAGADYTATSGSLSFGIGETTKTITVNIANDAIFEGSESFTVALANASGASIVKGLGTGTIKDDGTGAGGNDDDRPTISVSSPSVAEGSPAVFTVSLSNPSTQAISFTPSLSSGSATVGTDTAAPAALEFFNGTVWVPVSGAITIPAGATSVQLRIATTDDATAEVTETFNLLTGSVTGIVKNPAGATGTASIIDNDAAPTLSINDVTVNEAAGTLTFTVTRSGATGAAATVNFATSDGTATAGADYAATSGSLSFGIGETTKTITVNIANDAIFEGSESFTVALANASGATISKGTGLATIKDDGTGDGGTDDDRPVTLPVTPPPPAPAPAPSPVITAPAPSEPAPSVQPPAPGPVFNSVIIAQTSPQLVPATPVNPVAAVVQDIAVRYAIEPAPVAEIYTSPTGFRIIVVEAPQDSLSLHNGMADQYADAGSKSSFAVPYDAFAHSNPNEQIMLSASLANGAKLPNWIQFNPQSGKFEFSAPDDFNGELKLKVTARDSKGNEVTTLFRFNIGKQRLPAGRLGFSEQLRLASRQTAFDQPRWVTTERIPSKAA